MIVYVMGLIMVGLVASFLSGADSALCPSSTVQVNVTSTTDLQKLTAALACSGEGSFDIKWHSSLNVTQSIKVFDSKDVTITGAGYPIIRGALPDGNGAGAIVNAGAGSVIFSVSNRSSLHLIDLVVEGGNAENGGAVNLYSSSSLFVVRCTFVDNTASYGGAIYLHGNSTLQGSGTISFLNNTARQQGGAVFASTNSSVNINGDIRFYNNSAGATGGAVDVNDGSSLRVGGSTSFQNNRVELDGGAISGAKYAIITITGKACFANNVANRHGGAIAAFVDGSVAVNGNASFVNNIAEENGGALAASENWVVLDGNISFDNNVAGNRGGAVYVVSRSTVQTTGRVLFLDNHAGLAGGAMIAEASSTLLLYDDTSMNNNSAVTHGGAIVVSHSCFLSTDGNTRFSNNSAGSVGGAISAFGAKVQIDGNTTATHNSANSRGGGAIFAFQTNVSIGGCTDIAHNSGYDGGAILAQDSEIHITGNVTFVYNSARRDGGAMKTFDTWLIICTTTKGAELSSTNSLTGGATISAQYIAMSTIGTISFINNTAIEFGGALSLADYVGLNISDVTFYMNEAEFGGAVSLTSATWATATFIRCRFEKNEGTRGGALYSSGEGLAILQGSFFWLNVADTGGALFNAGSLQVIDTMFAENTAKDGGLAIQSLESAVELWNATFDGNILSCPSQMYSDTDHASPDSCRFELVCSGCLDACGSDLSNVTIDRHTLPVCEPIPVGVWPSSPPITLQTFDIKEGYFRISAESPIVLECYQKDACVGGIEQSGYCAIGYTGPYCAVCKEDYAPGPNSRCHKCSGENRGLLVAIPATVLFITLLATVLAASYLLELVSNGTNDEQNQPRQWWRENLPRLQNLFVRAIPLSSIRIVVTVLQIVIQFTGIAGDMYPHEYESFLSAMAVVNFDIGFFLSSSCFTTMDFYDRLVLTTVAPVVICLACGGTFILATVRNRSSDSAGPIIRHKHLSVVLFFVFFVYSSVSFTVFQTFVCDPLDDGNSYLRADYSITCFTGRHTAYKLYAMVMVFVYPVGIPAFFAFWLVRHRRELNDPNREAMPHLTSYRCLWGAYKPSCYYYEVVECGRRIVLTAVAVFVLPRSSEQIAIVLFLAIVFVFISESVSPFQSASDKWLYRWGSGIIVTSMYVAFLLKVDLAKDGTYSSSAITIVLIAANLFMVLTVAVNAVFLMRGLCAR